MGLVDDDGKMLLLQALHAVNDKGELLDGGGDDFCIAVQCNRKVSRITLVIHHADKASFMLHAHNGLLELPVYNNTVGDDDHVIKDDFVVSIVETRQAVRQPSDGVRLTGTCAVLYQIVLGRAVFPNVCQQLPNRIQLVVARENQALAAFYFSGRLIDLLIDRYKDKAADEVEDGILGQNILPHIRDAVLVLKGRIARSGGDPVSIAHIERQEEGRVTGQLRGHIDLFQVHRKVYEGTGLEQEQARFRAPLGAKLIDGVLIGLTGSVALELKGNDGKTVQEDDHVDALFVAGPDLLHHGENVLTVLLGQLRIEGGRGLGIHELQLPVGDFNAVLQHLDETATGFGGFCVDEADDGVL